MDEVAEETTTLVCFVRVAGARTIDVARAATAGRVL